MVQRVLRGVRARLYQDLLNFGQLAVEGIASGRDLGCLRSSGCLPYRHDLDTGGANVEYGVMHLGQQGVDRTMQSELLRQFVKSRRAARIRYDLERLSLARTIDSQLHLVVARQHLGTSHAARPQ